MADPLFVSMFFLRLSILPDTAGRLADHRRQRHFFVEAHGVQKHARSSVFQYFFPMPAFVGSSQDKRRRVYRHHNRGMGIDQFNIVESL